MPLSKENLNAFELLLINFQLNKLFIFSTETVHSCTLSKGTMKLQKKKKTCWFLYKIYLNFYNYSIRLDMVLSSKLIPSHENFLQIWKYVIHVFCNNAAFLNLIRKKSFLNMLLLLLCGFIYKKNQCENAYRIYQ